MAATGSIRTTGARIFVAACVLIIVTIILTLVVGLVMIQSAQRQQATLDRLAAQTKQSTRLEESAASQRRLLIECTTPSPPEGTEIDADDRVHECYLQGAARTGEAVARIIKAQIAVQLCFKEEEASDPEACVTRRLRDS